MVRIQFGRLVFTQINPISNWKCGFLFFLNKPYCLMIRFVFGFWRGNPSLCQVRRVAEQIERQQWHSLADFPVFCLLTQLMKQKADNKHRYIIHIISDYKSHKIDQHFTLLNNRKHNLPNLNHMLSHYFRFWIDLGLCV